MLDHILNESSCISVSLNDEMKKRRKENPVVVEVADILVKRVGYFPAEKNP